MSAPAPDPAVSRPQRWRTLAAVVLLGLAAAAPVLMSPAGRSARATGDRCRVPPDLTALGAPLPRTAARLTAGESLTIVALGSSSTEGRGATRKDLSYPSRLAVALQARFPGRTIKVVNRGVSGQVATQMLARLDRDVLAEKPDLVIWQLGTNSVLHDRDPSEEAEVARQGIEQIRATGADILLMDLQYAPAVLVHPGYREMERVLSAVAGTEEVPLFHRFAVMRHWAENGEMSLPVMLASDRLHMSDVSYDCLARDLAIGILDAALMSAASS